MKKNRPKTNLKKQITKKYIDEYNSIETKEEFVKKLLYKYPEIKKVTALRRYYDTKKLLQQTYTPTISKAINSPLKWKYEKDEKEIPHPLKIIMVKDMIRLGMKIDRTYLLHHGLNNLEINWLVDEGLINLKED